MGKFPSGSDSQGRPVYGAQENLAVYSVNDTNFHLELMGNSTVDIEHQHKLKATVWDLGIMVISIVEPFILFLDNIMYTPR